MVGGKASIYIQKLKSGFQKYNVLINLHFEQQGFTLFGSHSEGSPLGKENSPPPQRLFQKHPKSIGLYMQVKIKTYN